MSSQTQKRTSSTRGPPVLKSTSFNSLPHRPHTASSSVTTSAKTIKIAPAARGHGRTRSFLSGILERSGSTKRSSLPPPARPVAQASKPPRQPVIVEAAGLRAPGAQKKRLSAPADFKGKASVSSPVLVSSTLSPDMDESPVSSASRSSPYLTSKPLPLDEHEKMRLAAWDFGAGAEAETAASSAATDKGKARALDNDAEHEELESLRATASPPWDGWLAASAVSDFGSVRSVSMPMLAGQHGRLSLGSDTHSMIAFAGPSLVTLPVARPTLVTADPRGSCYSIPYHLSPILESDTASSGGHNRFSTASDMRSSHGEAVAQRPVLHIDPTRRLSRMRSDMSMSVYSRHSFLAREFDHEGEEHGAARGWGDELLSYFSPDTPALPQAVEGLAITGAEPLQGATTDAPLEGQVVFDPLPSSSLPSQIALSARPSFSAFAFPSTSSIATSTSSGHASFAPSPLFEQNARHTGSTASVATSTSDHTMGNTDEKKDVQSMEVVAHDTGVWRQDWGWDLYRRPEGSHAGSPIASPVVDEPTITLEPVATIPATSTSAQPVEARAATPPAPVRVAASRSSRSSNSRNLVVPEPRPSRLPSPVLLPLAARALRKREKSLPCIPDNASIWSGVVGIPPLPSDETEHVEVFCQRELVRQTQDGPRRFVVERTLLFTEEA